MLARLLDACSSVALLLLRLCHTTLHTTHVAARWPLQTAKSVEGTTWKNAHHTIGTPSLHHNHTAELQELHAPEVLMASRSSRGSRVLCEQTRICAGADGAQDPDVYRRCFTVVTVAVATTRARSAAHRRKSKREAESARGHEQQAPTGAAKTLKPQDSSRRVKGQKEMRRSLALCCCCRGTLEQ